MSNNQSAQNVLMESAIYGSQVNSMLLEIAHDLVDENGNTKFHKYGDNSIEELELLLQHHKEDLEENKEDHNCSNQAVLEDIEEIREAIDIKKNKEAEVAEKAINSQE